jgi:hypothetical protein
VIKTRQLLSERESQSAMIIYRRSGVKCFHCTHVFDLTNLKGEKRRNVGKLKNELNIVNQLVDLLFLLFVNITGN